MSWSLKQINTVSSLFFLLTSPHPLTHSTRKYEYIEYVRLYCQWILEISVEKQFAAFLRGFKYVCNGIFFKLFRVEEVELLICGEADLNFYDLEKVTIYDNGYTDDALAVRFVPFIFIFIRRFFPYFSVLVTCGVFFILSLQRRRNYSCFLVLVLTVLPLVDCQN